MWHKLIAALNGEEIYHIISGKNNHTLRVKICIIIWRSIHSRIRNAFSGKNTRQKSPAVEWTKKDIKF